MCTYVHRLFSGEIRIFSSMCAFPFNSLKPFEKTGKLNTIFLSFKIYSLENLSVCAILISHFAMPICSMLIFVIFLPLSLNLLVFLLLWLLCYFYAVTKIEKWKMKKDPNLPSAERSFLLNEKILYYMKMNIAPTDMANHQIIKTEVLIDWTTDFLYKYMRGKRK